MAFYTLNAVADPAAAERELVFKAAKKEQIRHSMIGIRDTMVFYTLADQQAVLVLNIKHKDAKLIASGFVYLFATAVTAEGISNWINNQHSDGLFPDVPEPILISKLPDESCSISERKLIGKLSQELDNKDFADYEVKIVIKEYEVEGKFHLPAFEDVANVYLIVEKPNIIVILVDDMGFSDLGCYGSEIETPNLDKLAADGLRFTNFYNTSRCCPTRAALLTGLYSHQAGVGAMMEKSDKPGYLGHLNRNCVTLAEAIKPAGYTTLMAGKWHVGDEVGMKPLDRGFDRYWGVLHGGGVYFKETLQLKPERVFYKDGNPIEAPDDLYVTDDFTDRSMDFIDEAAKEKKKPFFLYLAHIAPHWPLQAKPKDIEKYKGRYDEGWDVVRDKRFAKQKQLGVISDNTVLSPRDPEAKAWDKIPEAKQKDLAHRMEIYAAQVDCIDQNIGKLVAKLKETGQFDNTLILFMSDNGCSAEGGPGGFSQGKKNAPIGTGLSYASVGLEWANVSDTPFSKFKQYTNEGGTATPFIAHWPAGISSKGEKRQSLGHVIDIMPTLLEVSGAEYPKQVDGKDIKPYEGVSLVPYFKSDSAAKERDLFWEHYGRKAVRRGDWKAVSSDRKTWHLYNLKDDPTELNDLSSKEPEKTIQLKELWQTWAKRCDVLK